MNTETKALIQHYDCLIKENSDPVYDDELLKEYMNKWDGNSFIKDMKLSEEKSVLEIGVGTGRIAVKVAPLCKAFYGIDISPLTIERARNNLSQFNNVTLICDDYFKYEFNRKFDVVYSSLTFMHFKDKADAIKKAYDILENNGLFVLSIDKNTSDVIDYGTRKIHIYPDDKDNIISILKEQSFKLVSDYELEFAHIFVSQK